MTALASLASPAALAPLAAFPAPTWDGFEIGPVKIHAYALCIILGIVLALWLAERRWRARGGPGPRPVHAP